MSFDGLLLFAKLFCKKIVSEWRSERERGVKERGSERGRKSEGKREGWIEVEEGREKEEERRKGKMREREGGRVKKREILKEGGGGRERDFLERGAMYVTFYRTGRNCIRLNVA